MLHLSYKHLEQKKTTNFNAALAQEHYKWRHDQVLRNIACAVEEKRLHKNNNNLKTKERMHFLKEGENQ